MNSGELATFNLLKDVMDVVNSRRPSTSSSMLKRRRSTRSSRSSMSYSGSSSGIGGGVGSMKNVRFNDMGDRGGVTTTRYKRRKIKKIPLKKRRKIKRFRKAVRKVFNKPKPINTLNEFWTSNFLINADTPDTNTSLMSGNRQTIWGNSSAWGINAGEQAASGNNDLSYIAQQLNNYDTFINGVRVNPTTNQERDLNIFYVKRKYLKLAIRNTSTSKDLIFDLYECVAKQNIADPNYANPTIAWKTTRDELNAFSTGNSAQPWMKGVEPTDCPQFGRYWKILRKESVRIPFAANNINSYQTFKMHSKPFLYKGDQFNTNWAVKGKTKYFMLILDPEQTASVSRYSGVENIASVMGHRNTHYKTAANIGGINPENTVPNWITLDITTPTV